MDRGSGVMSLSQIIKRKVWSFIAQMVQRKITYNPHQQSEGITNFLPGCAKTNNTFPDFLHDILRRFGVRQHLDAEGIEAAIMALQKESKRLIVPFKEASKEFGIAC